jgi:hypothetical protein
MEAPTSAPPDWLADAVRVIRTDLVMYARTAVAMSLRPARFAAEWRDQRRRALNPVAFLGTALALSSPLTLAVRHFAGGAADEGDGNLWDAFLADQVAPYVQYSFLGLLTHALLRLLGARQSLMATMGIVLFAGGGPAMLVDLATLPLDLLLGRAAASASTTANAVLATATAATIAAANLAFFVTFARGLAGLHRVPLWRPVLALLLAYVALAAARIALFTVLLGGG